MSLLIEAFIKGAEEEREMGVGGVEVKFRGAFSSERRGLTLRV